MLHQSTVGAPADTPKSAPRAPLRPRPAIPARRTAAEAERRVVVSLRRPGRNGWHQIKDTLRVSEIVCDADRTRDGLVSVGDRASAPSADFLADQPDAEARSPTLTRPSRVRS